MNLPEQPASDGSTGSQVLAHARELDAICDRFEAAWKAVLHGATRPRLEDFTPALDAEQVAELVAIELHYRRRLGEQPTEVEYRSLAIALDPRWFTLTHLGAHDSRIDEERTTDAGPDGRVIPPVALGGFGEYDLLEEIARGGMGVVFEARHRRLGRLCALKMILTGRLASGSEVERFQAEARTVSTLDHPHIVPIYEVGEHDGQHFFSMRLIKGPSLRQIAPALKADPVLAARLMVRVAEAVQYAHSKAILHRDLKPANILLAGEPDDPPERLVPYVTDFGLAKHLEGGADLTRSGGLVGTPAYASPEQAAGRVREVGTATDVYGLGAVLYTLMTGQQPFAQPTVAQLLLSVQNDDPVTPRSLNAAIPADLQTICLKALQKDASHRYASAAEFAAELRRVLGGEPIHARPVGTFERLAKWVRRQPVVAGLIALLMVVTLLGVGTVFWKWRDAQWHRERADEKATAESEANTRTQEALKKLRLADTYQRVARADLELQANNVEAAERTLAECDPELRGWEWYYVYAKCHTALWSIPVTNSKVSATAFSPDGRYLAIASGEAEAVHEPRLASNPYLPKVEVIDLSSGKPVRALVGAKHQIRDLRYSLDGRLLYGCGGDYAIPNQGEFCAWEVTTGEIVWRPPGTWSNVWKMDLSPDGTLLALAANDTLQIWDMVTRRRLRAIQCVVARSDHAFSLEGRRLVAVQAVAFSSDGKRIAAALRDRVRVFETASGKMLADYTQLPGLDVRAVAWHPKQNLLAIGTYSGKGFLLNLDTRATETLLDLHGDVGKNVGRVGFTPSGEQIVMIGDGTVHVWRTLDRYKLAVLRGHSRSVPAMSISPRGHLLACGGEIGGVKVWDAPTFAPSQAIGPPGRIQAIALLPDGKRLVSAGHERDGRDKAGALAIWDAIDGRPGAVLGERIDGYISVAFSKSGLLAHDDGRQIRLLRPQGDAWDEWRTLPGHTGRILSLAFHPGGTELVSAGHDPAAKVWRIDGCEPALVLAELKGHKSPVLVAAYTPGGNHLLTGELNGMLHVWDAKTYQRVEGWQAAESELTAVAVHPSGKEVATGGGDGKIDIWELPAGRRRLRIQAHGDAVRALAYSPDGKRLASGGNDWDVTLWDSVSGQMALTFRNTLWVPRAVAFSPDGKRLIVGGGSRIKVWDADDPATMRGERLARWHLGEGVIASQTGQHAAALFHLDEAHQNQRDDVGLLVHRAWSLAELRRFEEAITTWRKVTVGRRPAPILSGVHWRENWMWMAFGNQEERRAVCAAVLTKYRDHPDPMMRHLAGVICTYRPDSVDDPAEVVRLAKGITEKQPDRSYHWEVLAAAHLRAGEWKESISAAANVRKYQQHGRGLEAFMEAVAWSKLGEPEKAKTAYDAGLTYYTKHGDFEKRSGTRYIDYCAFRSEAAVALGLPDPGRD